MSRRTTLPPAWAALAAACGGVAALAKACHVTTTSVRRWGLGVRPKSAWHRALVARAARKHGLACPLQEAHPLWPSYDAQGYLVYK
jgi:DNA-binding transcriptional regulator YdaS (Cro superfamily)